MTTIRTWDSEKQEWTVEEKDLTDNEIYDLGYDAGVRDGLERAHHDREYLHAEVKALRRLNDALMKQVVDIDALMPMPPFLIRRDQLAGLSVDHIDGDPTNNTPSNLRLVDPKAKP